jgi:hypothetical protein
MDGKRVVVVGVAGGALRGAGSYVIPYSEPYANRAVDGEILGPALVRYINGTLRPDWM